MMIRRRVSRFITTAIKTSTGSIMLDTAPRKIRNTRASLPRRSSALPPALRRSRITLCGLISQYGNTDGRDPRQVWREKAKEIFERQSVEAHDLWVRNFVEDHQDRFLDEMAGWIRNGRVKYREDLWQGLDQAPSAFRAMLKGGNFGKTLVAVGDDPTSDETLDSKRAGSNVLG